MTDRIHSLTVALDHDMRDDDVEALIQAIRMMRFVEGVGTNVSNSDEWVAEMRVDNRWTTALLDFLRDQRDRDR